MVRSPIPHHHHLHRSGHRAEANKRNRRPPQRATHAALQNRHRATLHLGQRHILRDPARRSRRSRDLLLQNNRRKHRTHLQLRGARPLHPPVRRRGRRRHHHLSRPCLRYRVALWSNRVQQQVNRISSLLHHQRLVLAVKPPTPREQQTQQGRRDKASSHENQILFPQNLSRNVFPS